MRTSTCPECGCPDCYKLNHRPLNDYGKIWWLCPRCGSMPEDRHGKPRDYKNDPVDKDPPPSRIPKKNPSSTKALTPPP